MEASCFHMYSTHSLVFVLLLFIYFLAWCVLLAFFYVMMFFSPSCLLLGVFAFILFVWFYFFAFDLRFRFHPTTLGRKPVSKHKIQPEYGDEQADAGWDS